MSKKLSKLQVFQVIGAILIVALCVFLVLCFVQRDKIEDLEVENSALEGQVVTIQAEHGETQEALKNAEEQVGAKNVEIVKLEVVIQEAEENFNALQVDHGQLEKKVKNLQSLRSVDRSKIVKLTAENKDLRSALSIRKVALDDSLNAIKEVRQSVNEGTQANERMLDAVAQSRARIAEMNEVINRINK